ncbi:MAG TPA: 30S ribosome-binding factor RbfA [Gemmatimonadales bacterium]|nr:30S ribosome-binding factor RbfA [Gemmatimonadales bacterium]
MAGKGASRRPEQVAEAIRAALAEALLRGEVRDPRVGMVTLSDVQVTRDLSQATVRVLPHGEPEEREAAVEALQGAAGFLRRIVAQALTTRIVPELRFVLDRGLEHAQRIDHLLAELRREEEAS